MLSNISRWCLLASLVATTVVALPVFTNDEVKRETCNIAGSIGGIIRDLIDDLNQVIPLLTDVGKDITTISSTLFSNGGCGAAIVSCISTLTTGGETCGTLAACTSLLGDTAFIAVVADAVAKAAQVTEDALRLTGEIPSSCISDPIITAIWPALDFTLKEASNFGNGIIHIISSAEKSQISLANTGFKIFVNQSTGIVEDTIEIAKPIISHAPFFNAALVSSLNDLESVLDSLKNVTTSIL